MKKTRICKGKNPNQRNDTYPFEKVLCKMRKRADVNIKNK
jgi:hypothetical protein